MPKPVFRPATLDDAELAADLMTAAYPAEPMDPKVTRFRFAHPRDLGYDPRPGFLDFVKRVGGG